MAKVKVSLESAKRPNWFGSKSGKRIGVATIDAMKNSISQGLSPVRGEGRFERYKNQGNKDKYPGNVRDKYPSKKQRPVNLYLNGWYLSHLTYWINKTKNYIGIGFSGKTGVKQPPPKKVRQYFETHNEGMHPDVPQRKHLPNDIGDTFTVSVEREYKREFERIVKSAINKMNKR